MTLWFWFVDGKRWYWLTFSAFVPMWVLFLCCYLWFEVLSCCVIVASADKCMGCGGFNVSVYVWQLNVIYLCVTPLVGLPRVFVPSSLFLSPGPGQHIILHLPTVLLTPPSHPRLSEYLHDFGFHRVSAATWTLLVSSPGQYWSVFHAAMATLLDSLGSMEKRISIPLILLLYFNC